MRLLYSIGIGIYASGVRCAALFNSQAAKLRDGWRQWQGQLDNNRLDGARVAWFHAPSLGEFEQARPVMELFKQQHPDYKICLSFFSPSGYEVRKDYPLADVVIYLPPDTRHNARRLVNAIHPDVACFVKYDIWYNILQMLQRRGTPTYLFSAIFRPKQYLFKPYGRWFARRLQAFSHIFVQNTLSAELLGSIGFDRCTVTGDTRFDRVVAISKQAVHYPAVEQFIGTENVPIIVAGSTWEPDETNLKQFLDHYDRPVKIVLAPHVVEEQRLASIEQLFGKEHCIRLSAINEHSAIEKQCVLIIDNIGMLSSLYRYATIAYVGGGFGKGIHNILEAAVYDIPVCFGPNHQKFQEAVDLLQNGGAATYSHHGVLETLMKKWLEDNESYRTASKACHDYIQSKLGATDTIIHSINATL